MQQSRSGITIGERAICMNGSNVTKSIPAHATAMGIPAVVRDGLNFYSEVSVADKYAMMLKWANEFAEQNGYLVETIGDIFNIISGEHVISVVAELTAIEIPENIIFLDVSKKKYVGNLNKLAISFIRWLAGNKARFYPVK